MSTFQVKLSTLLGAAFTAFLAFGSTPADAAPPPGMRWSDTVGFTSPRRQSQTVQPGSVIVSPLSYSYAPATVTSSTTPNPNTVTVRGPDGVLRTYQVEGPVVQQGAPSYVTIRGVDGVLRTYQVTGNPAPGSPAPAPAVTNPCK